MRDMAKPSLRVHEMPAIDLIGDFARAPCNLASTPCLVLSSPFDWVIATIRG